MTIDYKDSPVGYYLTDLANHFGASDIVHLGGRRYVARRVDGRQLRMLVDEDAGSIDGEDGFDAAWNFHRPFHDMDDDST